MSKRNRLVIEYTTVGLALGLDWATARTVAKQIAHERSLRGRLARLLRIAPWGGTR